MEFVRVREGDTLAKIAEEHRLPPALFAAVNGIGEGEKLITGEDLLLPMPTKLYRIGRRERPADVAVGCGVCTEDLCRANPGCSFARGELVAGNYAARREGCAVLGYVYPGCTEEALTAALPYLTYVALGTVLCRGGNLRRLFDDERAVRALRRRKKSPLLRVFCDGVDALAERERAALADALMLEAVTHGYDGVILPEKSALFPLLCERAASCELAVIGEGTLCEEGSRTENTACTDPRIPAGKPAAPAEENMPCSAALRVLSPDLRQPRSDAACTTLFAAAENAGVPWLLDLPPFAYGEGGVLSFSELRALPTDDFWVEEDGLYDAFCYRTGEGGIRRLHTLSKAGFANWITCALHAGCRGVALDVGRSPGWMFFLSAFC